MYSYIYIYIYMYQLDIEASKYLSWIYLHRIQTIQKKLTIRSQTKNLLCSFELT